MPTFVILTNFTEKGLHDIKDSPKRSEAFKETARKSGCAVREILYTQGRFDMVCILEAPDEATAHALILGAAKLGNIRTESLQAFSVSEMAKILEKVA